MRRLLKVVFLMILAGCQSKSAKSQVQAEIAFPQLSFDHPVDFQAPGDGSGRVFVVEQPGRIYRFENSGSVSSKDLFLDLTSTVLYGGEQGLLGLAFHPDYASNGFFYVDYVADNPRRTVIARYKVMDGDPTQADPASEQVLLEIDQPYSNHNGGQLRFGPDGYLYIAMGDGGSGGDPQGNGQDPSTLLGAILRIDVDNPENGMNYGIPADNPFKDNQQGYREEIFAYGLRNPWRFSFDSQTGELWAGDVGQNQYEEIDLIESGKNYGWNIMEGMHCYSSSSCDQSGLTLPIYEYTHDTGISITGGVVYRGTSVSGLGGYYLYSDYGAGNVWGLEYDGQTVTSNRVLFSVSSPTAFGTDSNGEVYICSFDGNIYKVTGALPTGLPSQGALPRRFQLHQNYPNPFNPATLIPFDLDQPALVRLDIYTVLGRHLERILERRFSAGRHSVNFDASEYASGTYIYALKVGASQDWRTMTVIK